MMVKFGAAVSLLLLLLVVAIGWFAIQQQVQDIYGMPLMAVLSVLAVFAVATLIAAAFKMADISNDQQALGLPDGSVRALLALSLIVVFAVITMFMLARLSSSKDFCSDLAFAVAASRNQESNTAPPSTSTQPKSPPAAGTSATAPQPPDPTTGTTASTTSASQTASKGGDDKNQRALSPAAANDAIELLKTRQAAAQDLAKQLLTMLGTLLTAVSSFYFGSSSTASAVNKARTDNPGQR